MNLTDPEILELNELCNALVDGAITAAQRSRLEQWLAVSEEARRYYVRAMALSASLCDYAAEMQSEAADAPVRGKIIRPAFWVLGSLAAAAAVVLAFWLGGATTGGGANIAAQPEPEAEESVARLSGGKDFQWNGSALRAGDELRRGQRIDLASGLAEITFDSGAQVTLEGPASLDLVSAWEAILDRGTLRAKVPPEAIGFRVSNPQVDVVDLGTEFTMVADRGGDTEVYVLKGAVEAASRDHGTPRGDAIVLREKQARRFAKSGVSEVKDRDQKMARFLRKVALDRLTRPANYVHWTFDETAGDLAHAELIGSPTDAVDATLLRTSPAAPESSRGAGRFRGSLIFDGTLSARAPIPGMSQRTSRTVAFWVKTPAGAQFPEAGPMLAWPLSGKETRPVEIAWNRNPTQGPLGAVRTRIGRVFFVGSTPLRDGQWHHLAVVFAVKSKPESIPQIKYYVDGRLDTAAARHSAKHHAATDTLTSAAARADALWLGQPVAATGPSTEHFRGELDELFVADRPLTPAEIRHLMHFNTPAPAETLARD